MPDGAPNPRYEDPAVRITFARIVIHYSHHYAWLDEEQILRDGDRPAGIPAILIHGRGDLGGPLDVPWLLAQAWPDAELVVLDTGHSGGDAMTAATVEATNRLAHMTRSSDQTAVPGQRPARLNPRDSLHDPGQGMRRGALWKEPSPAG